MVPDKTAWVDSYKHAHIFLCYIFYDETVFVPIYQLKYTTGNPVGNQFIGNVMM